MANAKDEYRKLKSIESLRQDLFLAYRKTSALRAKKMKLERQLERVGEKLKGNEAVEAVLSRREYQGLEIAESSEFLREIEQDAVNSRKKRRKGGGETASGKRASQSEKRELLLGIVRQHKGEAFMVRDISKILAERGISTPATTWLKSLDIPAAATPDVEKGNRRAGKRFLPDKVKWIADSEAIA